jgi:hypothetical protein
LLLAALFDGDKTTNHFGHYELPVALQALLRHVGDRLHYRLETGLVGKQFVPQFAVF